MRSTNHSKKRIFCPYCRKENVSGSRYCDSCGSPLLQHSITVCPYCFSSNDFMENMLCRYCGRRLPRKCTHCENINSDGEQYCGFCRRFLPRVQTRSIGDRTQLIEEEETPIKEVQIEKPSEDLVSKKKPEEKVREEKPEEDKEQEPIRKEIEKKPVPTETARKPKLRKDIRSITYFTLILSYVITAIFYYGVYMLVEPSLIIPSVNAASEAVSQIPSTAGGLEYYALYIYHFSRSGAGIVTLFPLFLLVIFLSELSYLLLSLIHRFTSEKRRIPIGLWKDHPFVSILIPAHNEEKVIKNAIETALETSYPNKEIIVINDGSTDGTKQIADQYAKKGLVRLINRKRGGKGFALNTGILFAKGEIVIVMDADGLLERGSLEKLLSHFQLPETAGVAGNVKVGNRINIMTKIQSVEYIREISLRRRAFDLLNTVYVIPGALGAFRKNAYSQIGSYDVDTVAEDMDITVKLLKIKGRVPYESEAVVHTEVPENLSSWTKQRLRWYGGTFQTMVKHMRYGAWWKHGTFSFIGLPYLFLSMFGVPLVELAMLILAIAYSILGLYSGIIILILISFIVEIASTTIAIIIEKEDKKLILYGFVYFAFYKYLLDITRLRSYWQVYRGKMSWSATRPERFGDMAKRIAVTR